MLLGYGCGRPFRWTDSAPWLAHLLLFLYISVLWALRMCCSIDRRPLARYIALTSCPHHFLPHAVHSGSASRCIPTRRGELGARTHRGWASKSWRFRHSVEMVGELEWIQSSQFISHSLGIPFELSNQITLVEYPKLCSTGVQIPPGFPPYSAENELSSPSFYLISFPSCPSVSLLTERVQTSAGRRTRRRNEGEGVNHHLSKRSLQHSQVYACAPRDDWQGDKRR